MDVDAVNRGDELRQAVELRLQLPPVVAGALVTDELLKLVERRALRLIGNRLAIRPARRQDSPTEIGELLVRDVDAEGRIASLAGAAISCDGARLAALTAAKPIMVVLKRRRRSWSMISRVVIMMLSELK